MLTRDLRICVNPGFVCRNYRRWHINTTRYVDIFTGPSKFLIDRHIEAGLPVKHVEVIRNGIPTMPGGTVQSAENGSALRLLLASRLTEEKGVRVVLRALSLLPANLKVTLEIAGKGPLEDEVKKAASSDPRIRFHGYVSGEAKQRLFGQVDCVLLPSLWYENAPVVIVEAGSFGLGVIGSDIGAVPEFVTDGRNGILFTPGSAESLRDAILKVACNPDLRMTFRHEGVKFASNHTVEQMVDEYIERYRRLSENRRNG